MKEKRYCSRCRAEINAKIYEKEKNRKKPYCIKCSWRINKMKKNKKAQVSIYFTFLVLAIIIIMIGAIVAPFGVLFNAEVYAAGEDILEQANASIENIRDDDVKDSMMTVVNDAFSAAETNVEVNGDLFQYSWIVVLVLTALVLFLYTRRLTEITQGGGLI